MNHSCSNQFVPLKNNASVRTVIQTLGKERIHRIPIFDKTTLTLTRFITQSEIIEFISNNIEIFGDICNRTVSDMGFAKSDSENLIQVCTIRDSSKMLWAFKAIIQNKISGIAVVDELQNFVGVVTVRDMRRVLSRDLESALLTKDTTLIYRGNLPPENFTPKNIFNQEIGVFLKEKVTDTRYETPMEPIICRSSDIIKQVIWKLSHNHIHRIYVVAEENKSETVPGPPIGVITLGDICSYLIKSKPDVAVQKKQLTEFGTNVANFLKLKSFDY